MATASDPDLKIEAYLHRVRRRLRGLSGDDAREILAELRSHIVDKASADGRVSATTVDAALAVLGNPEELAEEYLTDEMLARAEASRSPFRILGSLFRWASLSAAGFVVLLGSVVGYFFGALFMLVAVLKPLHPDTGGLWILPDASGALNLSLHLGFGHQPDAGREILGWWIVPVGLVTGCALLIGTTRVALWCTRQYRRSRALPPK
jgi:hypothetical protein